MQPADMHRQSRQPGCFYDRLSELFLQDMAKEDKRVRQQPTFLAEPMPSCLRAILINGFGSGRVPRGLPDVAPEPTIPAVDISGENLHPPRTLYDQRIAQYEKERVPLG
jgi:hypothetical protein